MAADWSFSLSGAVARLPDDNVPMRYHEALRRGTMKLGLYGPRSRDAQEPHKQDELYVIAKGYGAFVKNGERRQFMEGDVLFVEAGAPHRFEDFTSDFLAWVIFWGPEGGEPADS